MGYYNYEQIESYLNGELKGNDLSNFEAALKTDTAFAKQVNLYREIETSMSSKHQHNTQNAELQQTFNKLNQKYFNTAVGNKPKEGKVVQMRTKRFVIAALSVAAMFLLLWMAPWQQKSLFDQHYNPVALNLTERSSESAELQTAEDAYNAKDYVKALAGFENHLAANPDATNIKMALGHCYLNTSALDKAANTFETIANGGSIYAPEAGWYLAMTYLKQDQPDKAKTVLQKIPEGADYYEAARKLMEEL